MEPLGVGVTEFARDKIPGNLHMYIIYQVYRSV
jgi:hypothetical protein